MENKNYIKSIKIGEFQITHNLLLAPLAGISDYPFRQICREFGAHLTFTEMVSIDGLYYRNPPTRELSLIRKNDHPIGLQLFGSDPEFFKRVLDTVNEINPDLVDLNFGCPVRKVVKRGAGAALLLDLLKVEKIVRVMKNLPIPLLAKIRLGWNSEHMVAVEAAQVIESAGADGITVHARTGQQGYSGKANWEYISRVKESVKIPVIGNGDVVNADSAQAMFRSTGADGIMIARGALGRPWIFREILETLQNQKPFMQPNGVKRIEIMKRHYRLQLETYPQKIALNKMKKHFVWYTKGLPYATRIREQIFRSSSYEEIVKILEKPESNIETKQYSDFEKVV
jgi:tRNA-dihydrouridine synthase B